MIGRTAGEDDAPEGEGGPLRHALEVEEFARRCFTPATRDQVGAELEFLVFDCRDPTAQVPMARVESALPALPGGSRVTFEPGGQLELSGPAGSLPDALGRMAADVAAVRAALLAEGLAPV
ncbi:MAG: ergothioneine biosynthesis glutamate--cysteine ligase EgtA, partial [Nonomuraea sp.]|nr:ergothioneine biosynthesis glutamate--cysteine ligase EgtA [Nonomuraea sp.]